MLRISQYLRMINHPENTPRKLTTQGPVVIWNLIRRCNLACKHCYSISADTDFPGELATEKVMEVMKDLRQFGVPVLILSGGEPLLRPDIFEISEQAKQLGFYTALSTNGTLINEEQADRVANMHFDYVGISIDGIGEVHDKFRRKQGAYEASLKAIRLLKERQVKTGLRFTLTEDNQAQFEGILDLMSAEKVDKFYLSHLNYGGRGNKNRKDDVVHQATRIAVERLIERAWQDIQAGLETDFVTGNNDADAVILLHWVQKNHPDSADKIAQALRVWGGNGAGVSIANIDNLGDVHPDTFWWQYSLGNVKDRAFSEIWRDTSNDLMAGLKQKPRPVKGRCGACQFLDICGGNARIRAYQLTGDPWEEDPACYLTDEEIGIAQTQRVEVKPYSRSTDPHWKKSTTVL
ncbi:MAG: heme d1 biosynthesis radical SAM protein NirJ [Gammaproteobacteria bacterium CG22_combo_CG10-13_8_21_14_all_40_8]|nr:MAG: heme d1 biosynthesis radical SAM protein NirJ [Gammaproteobacteria bacterium CG22_combo_CG10-13_8_21_14_all_40_8]